MKKLILLLVTLPCVTLFAQFNESAAKSLFSDPKASKQGDPVTIIIVEETSADNTASTGSQRQSDLSIGGGAKAGSTSVSASASIGTQNKFSGQGSTSRNESVRARLSARIVDASNLNAIKIEGKRTVTINGETQTITLSGYIRFIDIMPDNSVMSYSIADLTLSYNGDGTISKAQEPGLFTKFLRFLF
ncbi:MAG: flagellar basal body L-ring protein FlgH [Candidatus Kapabacteria bacterium]|nr:flagellar basal body L-ring protein FlgH [Candidatus Kapabacteria bacterium]MBX7156456.1 flagellar basal body L-ring protein FlgH [Bacteroidota bacterium]